MHGATKSGHLSLKSYGQIYFNIFRYILRKAGFLWFPTSYIKKNIFINDYHWDIPGLHSQWFSTPEPPQKMFLVIFQGLRLSLGHFGQKVPESPVGQLQNGISTSPLPLLLWTY